MGGDHTAGVPPAVAALTVFATMRVVGGDRPSGSTLDPETVDFGVGSVAGALFLACLAAIPLGVSLWALLDAARRPRWAWALAERRQVVWMAVIMFGMLSVIGGLVISGYYLVRVRPTIAAAETGRV